MGSRDIDRYSWEEPQGYRGARVVTDAHVEAAADRVKDKMRTWRERAGTEGTASAQVLADSERDTDLAEREAEARRLLGDNSHPSVTPSAEVRALSLRISQAMMPKGGSR